MFTSRPLEWSLFVHAQLGRDRYEDIKRRAIEKWDGDIDTVVERLKQRASVLEIKW